MRKISYFNNILAKTNKEIGLPEILSIIGNGKLKSLTDQIKNEPDKEKRNDLKKKLPAVTISGTFSNSHSIKDFKEHSGLISIDIDDIQEPHYLKEKISLDKYTYVAFISPSGKGLKVIVKIEPNKENHLKNFYALQEYYETEYNISIDETSMINNKHTRT